MGTGFQTIGPIGLLPQPLEKVMSGHSFAHVMSHPGLASKPLICYPILWTWHGTDYFLGHLTVPRAIHCLNPNGRLVQKSLQPKT
jgi:hypothetical protein